VEVLEAVVTSNFLERERDEGVVPRLVEAFERYLVSHLEDVDVAFNRWVWTLTKLVHHLPLSVVEANAEDLGVVEARPISEDLR
jgi:hypothetical protein